jgi:hypothetical protein
MYNAGVWKDPREKIQHLKRQGGNVDGDGKFSKTLELNPVLFVFAYWYEFFSLNLSLKEGITK